MKKHTILAAVALLSAQASARASDEGPCFSESRSAEIAACLERELRGAEKLLSTKHAQLLDRVKAMEAPSSQSEAQYRARYVAAVRTADKQWRALVSTECATLAPVEFDGAGAGSMGQVRELNCRVDRTYRRIKEIGEGDGYRYLWSQ
jgi:uncharacterized protein YecT (DUF1311 family)